MTVSSRTSGSMSALTPHTSDSLRAVGIDGVRAWIGCFGRVADTRFVNRYNFFVLEVVAAWADPAVKNPRTIHHRGWGQFAVPGRTLKLPSGKA